MPTVLLIDDSLSMLRPIAKGYPDTYMTYVDQFLDKFFLTVGVTNFLEHLSVVVSPASSSQRHLSPFTRNYTELKDHLHQKNSLSRPGRPVDFLIALDMVQREFLRIWGPIVPATYLVITDGGSRLDLPRIDEQVERDEAKASIERSFHGILTVLVLGDKASPDLSWLSERSGGSSLLQQSSSLSFEPSLVEGLANRVAQQVLAPSYGRLYCGELDTHVQLHPPVRLGKSVSRQSRLQINIFGFLKIADVQSPPTDIRHLLLAVKHDAETGKCSAVLRDEDQQMPNVALLLHGALKIGKMVAIATVNVDKKDSPSAGVASDNAGGAGEEAETNSTLPETTDRSRCEDVKPGGVASGSAMTSPMTQDTSRPLRYALIYSVSDQRKANLVIGIFHEGVNSLSWLGQFSHLAPVSDFGTPLYNDANGKSPFPVRIPTRLSYWTSPSDGGAAGDPESPIGPSYPYTSWINPSVLSADVQKVVRMSRRIVDRGPAFYKEVNRVRATSLATGMPQVVTTLCQLLDREVSTATNAVAILELRHVIDELTSAPNTKAIHPVGSAKIKAERV